VDGVIIQFCDQIKWYFSRLLLPWYCPPLTKLDPNDRFFYDSGRR